MAQNAAATTTEELAHKLAHMSTNTLNKLDQTLEEDGFDDSLQQLVQAEQKRRRSGGSYSRSGPRTNKATGNVFDGVD